MEYVLLIFILILIIGAFLIFKFRKVGKISSEAKKRFVRNMKNISSPANSYKEQILDFDKLYHHILREYGYEGTFGEILKKKPKEISDLDLIWKLHKLRNKLAHDFDVVEERILKKNARDFKIEVEKLLK